MRAFLSKYLSRREKGRPELSNQNGRGPVQVSDQELLRARDNLIRREHSGPRGADTANAVRANWPLEKLTAERAEAWSNGRVLTVTARTGFSGWLMPGAREIDLPPEADDSTLGTAVREALSYSRELTLHDWCGHGGRGGKSVPERMAQYREWRDSLMRRHGYKTQRALYMNMLHVTIERRGGELRCSPSNHVKLDTWDGDGIPPNSDVVVPADSSAPAIGAALRLTFNRCLDTYGKKTKHT